MVRYANRLDNFYKELHNVHYKSFNDYRFGQLMYNIMSWITKEKHKDIFFLEEDEMIKLIKEYANTYSCWFRDN